MPPRMRRNLDLTGGLIVAEAVMRARPSCSAAARRITWCSAPATWP